MQYRDLPPISRELLDTALLGSDSEVAARALFRMALHDPDRAWAETKCVSALYDPRENVRAAAITCLGHIARIHRMITKDVVIPELERLKMQPRFQGIAEDALDDIAMFAR